MIVLVMITWFIQRGIQRNLE